MNVMKIDPRIIRTRKLIKNALVSLSMKKDFKDITIKEITSEATVNRATFYYHFYDKYDLLEKVLEEDLMDVVLHQIMEHNNLTPGSIKNVFLAISQFHKNLSIKFKKSMVSFSKLIEEIIKREIEQTFYCILVKHYPETKNESLRILAIVLSWEIYGGLKDWEQNSTLTDEEYINLALPLLTQKISLLSEQ